MSGLLGLETVGRVDLHLEDLATCGQPTSVDTFVVGIIPRIPAQQEFVSPLFQMTADKPVAINIAIFAALIGIPDGIRHPLSDLSDRPIGLKARLLRNFFLE